MPICSLVVSRSRATQLLTGNLGSVKIRLNFLIINLKLAVPARITEQKRTEKNIYRQ